MQASGTPADGAGLGSASRHSPCCQPTTRWPGQRTTTPSCSLLSPARPDQGPGASHPTIAYCPLPFPRKRVSRSIPPAQPTRRSQRSALAESVHASPVVAQGPVPCDRATRDNGLAQEPARQSQKTFAAALKKRTRPRFPAPRCAPLTRALSPPDFFRSAISPKFTEIHAENSLRI
jgi:hypothetical protein